MTAAPLSASRQTKGSPQVSRGKPRSLAANVRSGAIWNVASTLLLKFSGIGVTALVARILTPHDFGVFAVANTVFIIVSAFGEFGITSCLVRGDLPLDELAPTMTSISFTSGAAVAAGLVIFAQPIAAGLGSPDGTGPVRAMAIVMVLTGISAVPTAQCVRDFKQGRIFLANVLSFFPATAVLLVLAKTGDGAMAFAWSRVIGQLVSCIVIIVSTRRLYMLGMRRSALSILWKFGVPLAVANFVGYVLQNVDYALIGHFMGPVMLGTYVIAFNSASWSSSLLVNVLTTVAMPAFSRVKSDADRLMGAMADGVRAVMLVAAPMCTLVMVLADPIVLTIYGASWAAAVGALRSLALYGMISILCMLFSNMLVALGRSVFVLVVQVIWLGALIPAMMAGVRQDGINGAAVAHIIVIAPIVLPSYLFALKRSTNVKIFMLVKAALPSLVAAIIAALIAWFAASALHSPVAKLFVGGTAGGLFYGTVMLPQIVAFLGRRMNKIPKIQRVLRVYRIIGRSLGLRVGPPPRHARHSWV